MGKRELLIAASVIVLAAIVYQFTAPAPKDGEEGFSLRRVFDGMRREMNEDAARNDVVQKGTIPVGPGVEVIRISTSRSVPVTVEGEDRTDIAYEMPVQSTGPDAASALGYARRSTVEVDDQGSQIGISTYFPTEGRQTGSLTLRVPARLTVRIEPGGRPRVKGVAAVRLSRVTGEVVLEHIRGDVTGTHVSGDLTVNGAGSVNLILISSRVKLSGIERGVTANSRSGECEVRESHGPLVLTANSTRVTIAAHDGPIDIDGEGGQIKVDRPLKPVRIDIRRASVEVSLAGVTPMTIVTSEAPLQLTIEGNPAIQVDVTSMNGGITATDFSLQPEKSERASRLTHEFGGKAARVILRNTRAEIVIARAK
jgi:hypothetical protein